MYILNVYYMIFGLPSEIEYTHGLVWKNTPTQSPQQTSTWKLRSLRSPMPELLLQLKKLIAEEGPFLALLVAMRGMCNKECKTCWMIVSVSSNEINIQGHGIPTKRHCDQADQGLHAADLNKRHLQIN